MKTDSLRTNYEQMGRAALLPGMIHMLEQMQRIVDDFRAQLSALQNGDEAKRGPGHPQRQNSYWQALTPEQRSAEMRRRYEVSHHLRDATIPNLPEKVGADYTIVGAAKEVGLKPGSFKHWRRITPGAKKVAGRLVANPNGKGSGKVLLFTEREMDALRKLRAGRAAA